MPQSRAHLKATNKWLAENRERITVIVGKGDKDRIKARAESKGMSLNSYIVKLIDNDMTSGDV